MQGLNTGRRSIRIVLADHHRIVREALRRLLDGRDGLIVVGEAATGLEAVALVRSEKPDVLVLDIQMPGTSGFDALHELVRAPDAVKTLILTAVIDRAALEKAIDLGARGVVMKTDATECLVDAIQTVHRGEYWAAHHGVGNVVQFVRELVGHTPNRRNLELTERQREIVAYVVAGLTNPEIAERLAISRETVKHHLTQIFQKTGVSTRLELALLARDRDLVAKV
jgi:DNA-binding NarL/FixJ family response regulator